LDTDEDCKCCEKYEVGNSKYGKQTHHKSKLKRVQIQAMCLSWDLGTLLYQIQATVVLEGLRLGEKYVFAVSNTSDVLGPWDVAVLNTSNVLVVDEGLRLREEYTLAVSNTSDVLGP
jgi:hypothetical protein